MSRWEVGGLIGEFVNKMKKECPGIIIDARPESSLEVYLYSPALIFQHKLGRGKMIIVPHFDNTLYYDVIGKRIAEFFNEEDVI